jgi:5-methylthioadenosine/S-adenosylhomocysteine deaminase
LVSLDGSRIFSSFTEHEVYFMSSILIKNGSLLTLNNEQEVFKKGYVLIEDDLIAAVGGGDVPAALTKADHVIDAEHMAVMPGMVNAHTHLFQTFIRGLADDKPLLEWLQSAIWPVSKALTPDEMYVAAMVGVIENIRGGATAIIDHQYIHTDPHNDDSVCRAADEAGVRLLLARGWTDKDYHPTFMETQEQIISETARLRDQWQINRNGKIRVEFGPLIPWGCSDATMLATQEVSDRWGSGTHIHVSETREEVEMSLEAHGTRHIEWLAELGLMGPGLQLVHCVWLDDHEIDLIAAHDSIVIHCPVSNMYLASGVARIPEMLERGITVALATDGPGSNNSQDMLEVLKTTALLHKVNTLNAMILQPEGILRMACRGGAAAFGLPDQIGSLEKGKQADLVLVDLDTPMAMPVHRVASALVYNASNRDVDTVIVGGKILMQRKEILFTDEKAVLANARKVCKGLFERAGVVVQV